MQLSTSDISHPICFNSLVKAYQRWYKSFAFPGSTLRQIPACTMYFVLSSDIFPLISWNINTIPYLFSSSLSLPNIPKSEPTNYGTKFYNSGVRITAISSLQLLFLVLNHKFFFSIVSYPPNFPSNIVKHKYSQPRSVAPAVLLLNSTSQFYQLWYQAFFTLGSAVMLMTRFLLLTVNFDSNSLQKSQFPSFGWLIGYWEVWWLVFSAVFSWG